MKEKYYDIFMIETDPTLAIDLWEALDGYVPSEYPTLRIELWSVDGRMMWELLDKGEENPYYEDEPGDLTVLQPDTQCLNYRYPKLQLFTYFYKGIDMVYRNAEKGE